MNKPPFRLVAVACLGLLADGVSPDARASTNDYYPLWQKQKPNITDLALIYQGGAHRLPWTPDQFAPYVSWRDRDGRERWLFDGFLFIEFKDGRGHQYSPGYKQEPSRQEHWLWLLERNFEPGHGLPALERACRETTARIGPPLRRRQVVLTLPDPTLSQTNWGSVDGRPLDFHKPADRIAACKWHIQTALDKWATLAPQHLDLAGFYWISESATSGRAILPELAAFIRSRGLASFWIPYWHAAGGPDWQALGFDVAYQQPNHFFHPGKVTDDRLTEACAFARQHGMGLEMEFDGRLLSARESFGPRFNAYLDAFTSQGVKDTAAIAYYEGGGALLKLANSTNTVDQQDYHRLAQWVSERQQAADARCRAEKR